MANTKHSVVRLDNVAATKNPAALKSVKYFEGTTPTDIDNGHVIVMEGLIEGEREIHKGAAPAADSTEVLLVAGVELQYDESTIKGLDDFYNEANRPFRAIHLYKGDIFSVTDDALTGTKAVGNYVTVAAGTKLDTGTSATGTVIGKIIEKETFGARPLTYCVIEVQ